MRKIDLSRYDNSWYKPGSPAKRFLWHIFSMAFINNYLPIPMIIKTNILRMFGAKIGKKVTIKPKVNIKYPWFLSVSDHTWIGEQVWIDNLADVSIGPDSCLSQGAMLLTGNHNYKSAGFDLMVQPITLHEGVWIGAKAVVCPGVTCHSYSVLTVGSVATGDMETYGIYQGLPAQKIKLRSIT